MELSDQEKQTLLQLLDLATKAGGLNAANSALYFVSKLKLGAKPKEKKADVKEEKK